MTRPAVVARIPYLNAAPYYVRWSELESVSEQRWSSIALPPRQLGAAAERGEVDAGLMALGDLIRLDDRFEALAIPHSPHEETFGIANRTRVDSVLLFVRRDLFGDGAGSGDGLDLDPNALRLLDHARILVTGDTSTSYRLLRLLLEVRGGVSPIYERADLGHASPVDAPAALVIGDLALRWRHQPPEGFRQAVDLAVAWRNWTGLPFVFARWGVRRDLPREEKLWLGRFLSRSLDEGCRSLSALVTGQSPELGSAGTLAEYLANFTYRLGPEEMIAVARYEGLLRQHRLVDE